MYMEEYWFKNKTFGYGWKPATWKGWFVTALYIVAVLIVATRIDTDSHSANDTLLRLAIPFIALTFLFLIIAWRTGEPLEWRWGKRSRDQQ